MGNTLGGLREDPLNLLNKVIKDFTVTQLDTHEADLVLFCALVRETASGVCAASIAKGQWAPLKITLHLENAKAYEILNAIVAQNGKAIWTLMVGREKLSTLQFGGLWYVYPIATAFRISCFGKASEAGAIALLGTVRFIISPLRGRNSFDKET